MAIDSALSASKPPTLRRLGIDEISFRRPGRFATGFVDLDTYAGYNAAGTGGLAHAGITIDKFHSIRLANPVVTAVRCRRQQELLYRCR